MEGKKRAELVSRPLANFPPCVWGDHFASSPSTTEGTEWDIDANEEIEKMKEKVKDELKAGDDDPTKKIKLIDLLYRLGLSYHFQDQIDELLNMRHQNYLDNHMTNYDLYTTAILFRVFREQGFKVSSDIFNKFKDQNGKFKESLVSDAKGLLSLYEAAYLRIHGEDIMEEAIVFTTTHLKNILADDELKKKIHLTLIMQMTNALIRPVHYGIPRIETRQFISTFEDHVEREEDGYSKDHEMLLRFAKLDFNLLKTLYQKELGFLTRWYIELNLGSKLPYARERIVENYLWTVGAYFQPQYSKGRIILTQAVYFVSVLDDTYDAYGTIEELDLFTTAIDRWDESAAEHLPEYMKFLYGTILNIYKGLEDQLAKDGRSHMVFYAKEALKQLVRAYSVEARWCDQGYVPTFDEYMVNSMVTSTYDVLSNAACLGMGEVTSLEAFEWLVTRPQMLRASETIGRLMDDIVSHKEERGRKHVASSVECYMKQHGVNHEAAVEVLRGKISDAWKVINEESLRPTTIPRHLSMLILNLARVMDFVYKFCDGYTHSETIKDSLTSIFLETI